jgi:hypothetical protein
MIRFHALALFGAVGLLGVCPEGNAQSKPGAALVQGDIARVVQEASVTASNPDQPAVSLQNAMRLKKAEITDTSVTGTRALVKASIVVTYTGETYGACVVSGKGFNYRIGALNNPRKPCAAGDEARPRLNMLYKRYGKEWRLDNVESDGFEHG